MDQQAKQVKFSIITAAYNIENYIQRAIESVEKQNFSDYEFIIINDCSTDDTESKILEMCEKYNNIIYLKHKENKKAGGARNTGLKIASGEYILFLDGDDYFAEDDVLQRLNDLIGEDKPDIIYLGFKIEGDREELVIPTEETCTKSYKAAQDKYPNPWSKCWKKSFLDENNIRFPEYRFYEDVLFVYKGVMKSQSYKIADFVMHKYTSGRKNSMTTKMNLKNIIDTIQNLQDFIDMKNNDYTPEIDIILKKEIKMCKKRLDGVYETLYGKESK